MIKNNTAQAKYLLIACSLVFGISCSSPEKGKAAKSAQKSDTTLFKTQLKHATNFSISYEGQHTLVSIQEPFKGASENVTYRLVPQRDTSSVIFEETVIRVPVQSLVCTSTTHIAPLDMLEVSNTLVGFPSTRYISSAKVREQVAAGQTKELGKDNDLNIEMVLDLAPELLISYTMTGDISRLKPLQRAGIPVVMNAEYLEQTPLGRAEWIKFMALFFGKEREADSIFAHIEKNYKTIRHKAWQRTEPPTIVSGIVYGDTWYVPGGRSWAAKFFNDAGTDFLWKNDSTTGSLQLSFESVFEKAQHATFWLGAANFYSLDELRKMDSRYTNFDAFKQGRVFTYNARAVENGGNDYFESGFSRPDLILRDIVKITHPELVPDDSLYYFRKLD